MKPYVFNKKEKEVQTYVWRCKNDSFRVFLKVFFEFAALDAEEERSFLIWSLPFAFLKGRLSPNAARMQRGSFRRHLRHI